MREDRKIDKIIGTYVAMTFQPETIENLRRYQLVNKISHPLEPSEFHATIVFSRKEIVWEDKQALSEKVLPGATSWKIFRNFDDKTDCLILLLDSAYLQQRFDYAMNLGATYDFPKYMPHITLSYDIGKCDLSVLPPIDFPILFSHEYHEVLNLDWTK